jgi:hypothetical protein
MKLKFSGQILENSSNMKFGENPFRGGLVVLCGRTEGYDEVNSRFLKFCGRP